VRSTQGEFDNNTWLLAPNAQSPATDRDGLVPGGPGWSDPVAGFGVGVTGISGSTATVRIVPASASIAIADSLETLAEDEIGFDEEHWGGSVITEGIPECAARVFEYLVLARQQRITLVATPAGGMDPAHPVTWIVEGIPVKASGPVSFTLRYESAPRQVTLDAEVNGQTLVLRNRPVDGVIKFYVEAFADPPIPGVGSSVTSLEFEGVGRRYNDSDHDEIIRRCREAEASILRERFGDLTLVHKPRPGEPVQHFGEVALGQILSAIHAERDRVQLATRSQRGGLEK
jgi:hypothetical protein